MRASASPRHSALGRRHCLLIALGAVSSVLIALAIGASALAEEEADFKIIVNPENQSEGETRQFIATAFLKKVTEWHDGVAFEPVDQRIDSPVRRRFSERVIQRSVAAVREYWQQRIFSGAGVPPPEVDSDKAVVRYVLGHRGAIGYVATNADVGRARVLPLR